MTLFKFSSQRVVGRSGISLFAAFRDHLVVEYRSVFNNQLVIVHVTNKSCPAPSMISY